LESRPPTIEGTVSLGEEIELDFRSYRLRRAGRVLKLERIPMEILLMLVEQRAQIVTRESIAERIWGKDVFLDTDNSINGAIRKIRLALRDDSEAPRFIQTVTGSGYRFIAPVTPNPEATEKPETAKAFEASGDAREETAPVESAGTRAAVQSPATPFRSKTRVLLPAMGILVAAAFVGWVVWSRSRHPQPPAGRVTLAVLPFQNLTGDAGQDYFSDGLTEEMIAQVGNLDPQHLRVIARTSVMRYKNSETPLDRVARELGVQYVIEGSVRRDADNVRIAAELIQAKDQTHVWARQYDRRLTGLLALQGEIAREIADEILLTLEGHSHAASPRPAIAPREYEAYDLYLRGQYFFNERTVGSLRKAIEYFQKATVTDPTYARAYTGLADSYALMGGYTSLPPTEFMPKARAAALRALEIDDRLAEAHTALALIVQNYDWDWQTSEREFRRAIELNPNYATAHQWYAEHLMWLGRFDEALRESERARELDPLSLIIAADKGAVLFFSRDYDRAIEEWRSVLEMDPGFVRAHLIRAAYLEKGMFAEALADIESTRSASPVADYHSWRAHILGRSGRTEEARHALHELLQFNRGHPLDAMIVAWAYLGLGDRDEALGWLEKAYAEHSTELTSLRVHPGYDSIRGDPRFQDLLRRVNLAK